MCRVPLGARKDALRWVTHGPSGDVFDAYTTLPWSALCEAVGCLRVSLKEGKVVAMHPAADGTDGGTLGAQMEPGAADPGPEMKTPATIAGCGG